MSQKWPYTSIKKILICTSLLFIKKNYLNNITLWEGKRVSEISKGRGNGRKEGKRKAMKRKRDREKGKGKGKEKRKRGWDKKIGKGKGNAKFPSPVLFSYLFSFPSSLSLFDFPSQKLFDFKGGYGTVYPYTLHPCLVLSNFYNVSLNLSCVL